MSDLALTASPMPGRHKRVRLVLLAVCCALFSMSCMTWSTIVEVTRTDDGQHLIGTSIGFEFHKRVWTELTAEDRQGLSSISDNLTKQGWKVATQDGGRIINASRDPAALDALTAQGWSVAEQKLDEGRIITATLPFLGFTGTASDDPANEPIRNIVVIIDESDPNAPHYKYQTTVQIEASSDTQGSGSAPPASTGNEWGDAINQAIQDSPDIQRLEQALKEAGPPTISIGAHLPGNIESATVNGSPAGTVLGNSVQWTLSGVEAGVYDLEANALAGPQLELFIEEGYIRLGNNFRDEMLPFGEPHEIWAEVKSKDKKTGEIGPAKSAQFTFYYDGSEIGSGETDAEGKAEVTFSLPDTTPEGRSEHQLKLVASKKGLNTVEASRDFAVGRGLEKVVVWLDSVPGTYKVGDKVKISGEVGVSRMLGFTSDPVEAAITVDDQIVGHSSTQGAFSVEVSVPDVAFHPAASVWQAQVLAIPNDTNRYVPGLSGVSVTIANKGSLNLLASMDKAVYKPDDNATIAGVVTADGQPMETEVEVVVGGIRLGSVRSGPDGQYNYTFKPSTVPLRPTNPSQIPGGNMPSGGFQIGSNPVVPFLKFPLYIVEVRTIGTQGFVGRSVQTFFNVSDEQDTCPMESMFVSGIAGNPLVGISPEQVLQTMGSGGVTGLLPLGGEVSQGMRVRTTGSDRATFTLLLDKEKNTQGVIAVGSNTTMDVGLYCREPNGKLHVVLRVNTPGQVMVRWPSGTNAVLHIHTPRGAVSNVHTEYLVTVDEAGTTSVATLEGTARLSDDQDTSIEIEAGKAVTLREGEAPTDAVPNEITGQIDPRLARMLEQAALPAKDTVASSGSPTSPPDAPANQPEPTRVASGGSPASPPDAPANQPEPAAVVTRGISPTLVLLGLIVVGVVLVLSVGFVLMRSRLRR